MKSLIFLLSLFFFTALAYGSEDPECLHSDQERLSALYKLVEPVKKIVLASEEHRGVIWDGEGVQFPDVLKDHYIILGPSKALNFDKNAIYHTCRVSVFDYGLVNSYCYAPLDGSGAGDCIEEQ